MTSKGGAMNAEYMMVNPNDLVIDMPLDESNVAVKVESLRNNGMIQPVTVWLQDMRIIDGFHRTEAAKRLGWASIPCNVIDCSEDAFWDARIQSAKQHHNIEQKRLESWIVSCWEATEWDEEIILDEAALLESDKLGIVDFVMAEIEQKNKLDATSFQSCNLKGDKQAELLAALNEIGITTWAALLALTDDELQGVAFRLNKTQLYGIRSRGRWRAKPYENPLDDIVRSNGTKAAAAAIVAWRMLSSSDYEQFENAMPSIGMWFEDRSQRWGCTKREIADAILSSKYVGNVGDRLHFDGYNGQILKSLGITTLPEAIIMSRQIPDAYYINTRYDRNPERFADEYRDYLGNREPGQSKSEYDRAQQEKAIASFKLEQLRHEQYVESPHGRAQLEQERARARLGTVQMGADNARASLLSIRHVVAQVPEAPAMLAEFAEFVRSFIAEHFPDLDTPEVSPVALENARLRNENQQLRDRVASLERALSSKESAGAMLAGAIAWSSGDLER